MTDAKDYICPYCGAVGGLHKPDCPVEIAVSKMALAPPPGGWSKKEKDTMRALSELPHAAPAPAPPADRQAVGEPTSDDLCAALTVPVICESEWQRRDIEALHCQAAARIAALETDVKRARNNAEWLYEQTSNLDTRAEAAEAHCAELEQDAARLDLVIRRMTGKAWREMGIVYSDGSPAGVRAAIDAARKG